VTVVGFRTRRFPGFLVADSGFGLDWSVETPRDAADVIKAQLVDSAVIIANPVTAEDQLDPDVHQRVLEAGLAALRNQGIHGKAITPFLLEFIRLNTSGASLDVNLKLVRSNARLAAQIAAAL
jgi:pseudouridine-5'-phosphate glycosidase